jgi:asparagine synthase (glutamine-hydrolysing)
MFCSRDRFGVKPFYYYEDEEKFLFASEIKALLAAGVEAKVNFHTLLTYLVVGFTNYSEDTFFLGVYQLLPGRKQCLDLVGYKVSINCYYNLAKQYRQGMTAHSYIASLQNSVKLHLRSDVTIGTCLSGGLDSSVVAALASSLLKETVGHRSFGAVTAISESSENDESSYAQEVVEHCGLEWHPVKPTYKDFVDHIEDCLMAQGEPVGGPSLFMQYWVMKKAKEEGFKVMLDGQGGDETLLGYERYYPGFFWNLLKRGKVWRMMSEYVMAARNSKLSLVTLALYTMYFLILPVRRYILVKRASFINESFMDSVFEILRGPAKAFFNIRDLQDLDIGVFQLPNLLLYEDQNSMAHSIEARVPFVELNCIETGISLRPEEKICKGFTKYPLRLLAEKILPKLIAWRTYKIGFEAPTQLWLSQHQDHMQKMVDESLLLKTICRNIPRLKNINLEMRWKLYNVAVWEKQYKVSVV